MIDWVAVVTLGLVIAVFLITAAISAEISRASRAMIGLILIVKTWADEAEQKLRKEEP